MEKKRRREKKEEREPRLPGDKGEEATGHTKQLGTFGTPRCEHRQPQQLNQKEIIFWLNNFILEQKLKIKTTVALSEDPLQTNPPPTPPKKNKKINEYILGITQLPNHAVWAIFALFLKTKVIFGASS